MSYGDPWGWLITKIEGSYSIWAHVSSTMDRDINNAVNMAMTSALPDQPSSLIEKDLPAFVVPGSAQLFLGNIFFNTQGDMMIGLSHKS